MLASNPLLVIIGEQSISRLENYELWLKTVDHTAYEEGYKAHLKALSDTIKKCRIIAEREFN